MAASGSDGGAPGAGFVWGVSASAPQIEGSVNGRGPSIWDAYAAVPGAVRDGSTLDPATDHVRRYREDVRLLSELGVGAYRFSIAWPRVMPAGKGKLEPSGVDFYLRLIDALLAAGIEPWVCLYHWDLPLALQERGGWPERDTAWYFADYVERMAEALGSSVGRYFVMNEPNVHAVLGHIAGVHAPGGTDLPSGLAALHHLNLATGLGLGRLRSLGTDTRCGTILSLQGFAPATDSDEDRAVADFADAAFNRAFLEPLLKGEYPPQLAALLEAYVRDGDLAVCCQPIDMLGVNHYTRTWVAADPTAAVGLRVAPPPPGSRVTAMGWEVAPDELRRVLLRLKDEYGNPPTFVTENGAAYSDARRTPGGQVDDAERESYLRAYLKAACRARTEGCDLRGYFVWTLVDNFEWADGFSHRFGLVELAPDSLERVPKRSYYAYQRIVAAGDLALAAAQHDGEEEPA